jgi:hypothetical protein
VRVEEAHLGMKVRVGEYHRRPEVRGVVGKIVGSYGAPEYMALDVRLPDGRHQLFWARDLEEVLEEVSALSRGGAWTGSVRTFVARAMRNS